MKILKVVLSQYKRLALKHINYIEITPESKIQLILGTNGSGKSSLIKELSPMPGVPKQFHKGGFKIFEATHNNSHYVLKSLFHVKGDKYHFIKDGKDLMGDGGNSSVYKDLVKQEFGITAEVHNLMLGEGKDGRFTAMDISKRRSWLTRFSDVDYTYAMSYYKRLKEQLRECTIGIKLQQARLLQETEKLLKPEDEARCREDMRVLNEILSGFLEMKTPTTVTADQVVKKIKDLDEVMGEFTKFIFIGNDVHQRSQVSFKSIAEIDDKLIQTQANIQSTQYQIDKLCTIIEQQQKTMAALRHTNVQSASDIDVSIDSLGCDIHNENSQVLFKLEFEDPRSSALALESIRANLIDILLEMEINKDKQFGRESYLRDIELDREIATKMKECTHLLDTALLKKKELEHLKDHGETTCPKCDYTWFKGYDEVTYNNVLSSIKNYEEIHLGLSKRAQETTERLERTKTYLEQYRSYTAIMNSTPALRPFWQHVMDSSMIFDNPKNVVTAMENLVTDFFHLEKIEQLKAKMKENLDLKVLLSRNQQTNLSKIIEEAEASDKELYQLNLILQQYRATLSSLNHTKKNCISMQALGESLKSHLNLRDKHAASLKELYQRQAVNECIRLTQSEIAVKEQIISRANVHHNVINSIKAQIEELTEKAEVLKMAVDELSPAGGLIAKGLTGFINHFVFQVNSFIKKVWLYPLEITPITPDADDDVDLDYNFQVRVNDEVEVIDDIDMCSSGMKEIIDLSFRVVSMQYLGLHESPLFLDEFARAMDAAHRKSAFYVITNLLATSNFSQIFMISHYEDSYGSLANTDITVLCDKNIELSEGSVFNRNTIIR